MNNFEQQLQRLPKGRLSRRADWLIRLKLIRAGFFQAFSSSNNVNFFAVTRLRPVLAGVVILVLVFSGATSVYAYNSNEVTRVSLLYPVKRGMENLEGRFATTPADQVNFHNKLAGRRIAEAQFLSFGSVNPVVDQAASSTEEETFVELKHEKEFNDTLHDADNEIEAANEQAGQIASQAELNRSLALLSDAHLNELDQIKTMAEGLGLEADEQTTDNIALVLDNIKNHQQTVIRAISQFDGDLKKAEADGNSEADAAVNKASSSEENINKNGQASTTPAEAESSLNRAQDDIRVLETELSQGGRISEKQIKRLTERLNKKIIQARSAIDTGDLNKFNGLLRATEALTNNGEHFLKERKRQERTTESQPIENYGKKIKGRYSAEELKQKQEEQRLEETKKAMNQVKANENIETDQNAASSGPTIAPNLQDASGESGGRNDKPASSTEVKD